MKLLLIALLALPLTLPATTLNFTFNGFQESTGYTAVGNGTLSFADGLVGVGLHDLTGFTFVDAVDYEGYYTYQGPQIDTSTYTIADVNYFFLALGANNLPDFFRLSVQPADGSAPKFSVIEGTGPFIGLIRESLEGNVIFSAPGSANGDPAPAPEPATLSLCGLSALVGGFGALRRSKQ